MRRSSETQIQEKKKPITLIPSCMLEELWCSLDFTGDWRTWYFLKSRIEEFNTLAVDQSLYAQDLKNSEKNDKKNDASSTIESKHQNDEEQFPPPFHCWTMPIERERICSPKYCWVGSRFATIESAGLIDCRQGNGCGGDSGNGNCPCRLCSMFCRSAWYRCSW